MNYPLQLSVSKKDFCQTFLATVSKICDQCTLIISADKIYTIVNSESEETILYIKYDSGISTLTEELKINIGNVKKLYNILNCIEQDVIDLIIDSNNIQFKSTALKFKYHLFEEGAIKKATLNVAKIEAFKATTSFDLSYTKLQDILKISSFVPDNEKLYFYTKDGRVYTEITDMSQQNVDGVTVNTADTFTGEEIKQQVSINLELIRNISALKSPFTVNYNSQFKVLVFENISSGILIKYIVSTYIN